ncbi:MAG: hypothetical protein EBZ48_15770, partial [Proteobacteria bacterium]|nr:hypothetical protein [Pseudomonadota bacterium]
LAAFLYGQLEVRERVQSRRRELWSSYQAELREWADLHGVGQPQPPADCAPAWHMYSLIMPSLEVRSAFIAHCSGVGLSSLTCNSEFSSPAYTSRVSIGIAPPRNSPGRF